MSEAPKPPKLGELISEPAFRDAVHIAVAPVIAGETLKPGQHIGFISNSEHELVGTKADKLIGIVDPYLKEPVNPWMGFYMFLYPNTITSLRHSWAHPEFEDTKDVGVKGKLPASEQWLRDYAEQIGTSYAKLLEATHNFINYGDYFSQGGDFEGMGLPDDFWTHYQNVTNVSVPTEKQHSFFSCSC